MLRAEDMPDDREDLASVEVTFPPLESGDMDRASEFVPDIVDYLDADGETVTAEDLRFLRAALVEETKYWVWAFGSEDDPSYVFVSERPGAGRCVSYDFADGLTPEQAILADYHECY